MLNVRSLLNVKCGVLSRRLSDFKVHMLPRILINFKIVVCVFHYD